tara:strand:+ start:284 stop:1204 length:921 start_codon:yes stop_codon:yes gene_type:complete
MKLPKVAIVSLNWNGLEHLKYFCRSVNNLDYNNFFTVIVDNASTDDSISFIKNNYPKIKIVRNSSNLGYSKGFNVGIDYAINNGAEYLLITNNDLWLDSKILKSGIDLFIKDKKIGYMGGKVYDLNTHKRFQYAGGRKYHNFNSMPSRGAGEIDIGQYEEVKDFDYMDDVCSLVSKELITKVGPYDPDFFFDFEETEWNFRIRNHGYRIVYNPLMKVWHRNHGSTGGSRLTSFAEFNTWRGKILFHFKTQPKNTFLFYSLSFLFFSLPIRFIILSVKYCKPNLFLSTLKGVLSSLKRVMELKNISI